MLIEFNKETCWQIHILYIHLCLPNLAEKLLSRIRNFELTEGKGHSGKKQIIPMLKVVSSEN